MNAYAWQAALWCENCIAPIVDELKSEGAEDNGDSDQFPQGPYDDGGGEADCPQHCDKCHVFLENSLTPDGRAYVAEKLADGTGDAEVLAEWSAFYDIAKPLDPYNTDDFTRGYLECALWSSTDEDGTPLDDEYSINDIAPETLAEMIEDCTDFQEANADDLAATGADDSRNGHDFWLTRNGHGAGFWDRGYGAVGDKLSAASKVYGAVDLYVDDDDLIHGA